jgi:NADH dehydrogenase
VKKEKVLIVGGGFGGVKAALKLSSDSRFDVTLLSDETDFRYYPALYHTATGGTRANSSISLSTIFKNQPVKLVQGRAADIDRKGKMIITEAGVNYAYETLILSLGVVTNYFGIPGLPDYSYSIKSQDEVEKLKEHLHQQLIDERKPDLSYVIIGAGPTGIELAGSLPAYLTGVMKRHGLPRRKIHVDLIEAAPTLLPRLPKDVSRSVGKRLRKLKVKLHVNSIVQGQTPDELTVSGKPIRSHTVIWTAGVTNNPFFTSKLKKTFL